MSFPLRMGFVVSDHWHEPMYFPIAPKSGPIRKIETLLDAGQALRHDLPDGFLKQDRWLRAGQAVAAAAYSGDPGHIRHAYESFVNALDHQGWLSRSARVPPDLAASISQEPPRPTNVIRLTTQSTRLRRLKQIDQIKQEFSLRQKQVG